MKDHTSCAWAISSENMQDYHDTQWGVPLHHDQSLFEFLILESFQAGLSWSTILNKRDNFRTAFDNFDWRIIASYSQDKEEELIQNKAIIRNKLKIKAAITNAQAFEKVISEFGTFDTYIWQFVNNKPIQNNFKTMDDIPAMSPEAEAMSKDLKKRGFKFIGPTVMYAFMQATGMVNDHIVTCKRHQELIALS